MRTTLKLVALCLMLPFLCFAKHNDFSVLEKRATDEQNPTLFNKVADQYLAINELSSAKVNAEKGLLIATESGNATAITKSNEILGIVSKNRFDYTNATEFLLLALDGWKKANDEEGIARVNLHIGQIFYYQKDYHNALVNLNRSKDRFEKLGQQDKLAEIQKSLGDVYLAQNFFGKAKESYTNAFDLNIEQEAYEKAAAIARFLGKITLEIGDYEGALVYFSQSLDVHGSLEDLPNIATDYNDLALTMI